MIISPATCAERHAALVVDDLTVSLGGRELVRGVRFEMAATERVALIGASGSGKSLTAAAVLGTLPIGAEVRGSVRVAGTDVSRLPPARRSTAARVAAVGQDPAAALNPLVPVGAQLALPLRNHRGLRGAELARQRAQLLSAVGLDDTERVLRSSPGELSGGQRQRVCIAMALASRAGLLVADEPTTALDLVTQAQVVAVLREASRDAALLFITHDLAVAASLCDRAVVLHAGAVVEDAPITRLLTAPQHEQSAALVAAARAGALPTRAGAAS
ncbi:MULTISPECIES: ATP-binding cassette domain-containing protein [unclassified Modestobacter]|uniref:ATP-binding cassette domain-containing protein n=1 Tax=unclassified Modestobacter TaxID=2643866 RepID=UPI0022AA9E7B|nr:MULTISPECIES: ABC transporter ATP-binding protein [unclassified Modestobacter]MCZ2826437.1 ABC transporter ATP-binding protein [Modestobacter sp. VKM Ac-2981]MCZ2852498.1 ABC transporter ATP-binding protein [Modestobacter sp. VKM Ac-2982]